MVDGGSTDRTLRSARQTGARVLSSPKGRGTQLNTGACAARGDVLLFLHADSRLPNSWCDAVQAALAPSESRPSGAQWGAFASIQIDVSHVPSLG